MSDEKKDDDTTIPGGLTKGEDGVISIGPGGLQRALKDQEAEMKRKQDEINAETEDPNHRKPGDLE